jgi:hypothetical protein
MGKVSMSSLLSKNSALALFCHFRQTERSVHYALSSPSLWEQFLAYYEPKETNINQLIKMVTNAGAAMDGPLGEAPESQFTPLMMVREEARRLINPWKRAWSFSIGELSYFRATMARLLTIVHSPQMPPRDELIELRLDCFKCHYLIHRKLTGIPELTKASSVEHFLQSDCIDHFTLEEICTVHS